MHPERELQQNNLRSLMQGGKSNSLPVSTLRASKKRMVQTARLLRKAYERDAIVAWRSPFAPTEIFHAMDIVPFCVEAFSSMLAGSLLTAGSLNVSENNYYSRDICSFLRCSVGAAMEDYLPTPDLLVCTTYYCDSGGKTFYNLSKKYKKDYFFLDIPYHYDKETAVEYLSGQLKRMVKDIEERFGRKMDPEKLKDAIHFSNEARDYFVKANELRKGSPLLISGREAIDFAAIVANTWGMKEAVELYKLFYEELHERSKNRVPGGREARHNLLWRHLRPYYNDEIMVYLEDQCSAAIAFEEVNYIHWGQMDPQDPYRSLALKMLSNSPIGPIERWIKEATMNFIEWYKIDGVIEFAHWGCRHLNSASQILKNSLQERNVSLLVLDGDCVDKRDYSREQIKTRLDTFLGTLGRR